MSRFCWFERGVGVGKYRKRKLYVLLFGNIFVLIAYRYCCLRCVGVDLHSSRLILSFHSFSKSVRGQQPDGDSRLPGSPVDGNEGPPVSARLA